MEIKKFKAGQAVILEGENGKELFLVSDGKLKCSKKDKETKQSIFIKYFEHGEVFGELALLYNTPRSATIECVNDSTCFSLDRGTFNHVVKNSAIKRRQRYNEFLSKIEILKNLSEYEREKLCDCLQIEHFKKGEFIIN